MNKMDYLFKESNYQIVRLVNIFYQIIWLTAVYTHRYSLVKYSCLLCHDFYYINSSTN